MTTCRKCDQPATVENFVGALTWCDDHGRDLARLQEDQAAARAAAIAADRRAEGARYAAAHLGKPWRPGT